MNDDDLVRALGATARRRDDELLEDPRLEKLLRGELSAEEVAALEAEARTSPDLALALRLFRPHSPEARQRVLRRVVPTPPRKPVLRWLTGGAALAMSAAAAFALIPPQPLPVYGQSIAMFSDRGALSADADLGVLTLSRGARLEITLVPVAKPDEPVRARGFLLRENDAMRDLAVRNGFQLDVNRSDGHVQHYVLELQTGTSGAT